jgi:hypothetical protein
MPTPRDVSNGPRFNVPGMSPVRTQRHPPPSPYVDLLFFRFMELLN